LFDELQRRALDAVNCQFAARALWLRGGSGRAPDFPSPGGKAMKTWTKPVAAAVEAGFEVTRYLPSALDVAAGRACKK
jgi:hypothetical protein